MVISSAKPPVAKETTVSNVPVKEESQPRDIPPTETVSKYISSVETPEKEPVSIATLSAEQEKTDLKPKDETQYKTIAEKKPLEEMPLEEKTFMGYLWQKKRLFTSFYFHH